MNFIDKITKTQSKAEETLVALKNSSLPLILWGCGGCAKHVYSFLKKHSIILSGVFVDIETNVKEFQGLKVSTLDEISSEFGLYNVIVGHLRGYTRMIDLEQRVNCIKNVFSIDVELLYPNVYEYIDNDYISQNAKAFEWTYNQLFDDLSKESYLTYLNAKVNKDFKDIIPLVCDNQYFCDDIVRLTPNEVFVDCGAFTGDTVEAFINTLKKNAVQTFKSIYAFEPDADNFTKLCLLSKKYPNLHCINKGAWSEQTSLRFASEGTTTSAASSSGEVNVEVDTIDNVLSCGEATFIKMDIEGAELNALKGAEQTIRKYKPKLAICVYHKADDLITIPQYIKALAPEYKFYFRLHDHGTTEAVLYAVYDK